LRYTFEWDPEKAKSNLHKHKISFERAAEIFLDPFALSIPDEEHSDNEERWVTTGKDAHEVILVVIHTFREIEAEEIIIRIISARRAARREVQEYEGGEP
jgi:uncharacterized protein